MAGDLLDEAFDEEDSIEYQNTTIKAMVTSDSVDVVGDSRRRAPQNGDAALPVMEEGGGVSTNVGRREKDVAIVSNGNHRATDATDARPSPPSSSSKTPSSTVVFTDGDARPPSKLEGERGATDSDTYGKITESTKNDKK